MEQDIAAQVVGLGEVQISHYGNYLLGLIL